MQTTTIAIEGIVCQGYQIASGMARNSPYPEGSIRLQIPAFKKLGLDLSHYFAATLNIDLSPMTFEVINADYQFYAVEWIEGVVEDFFLDPCQLSYAGKSYSGFIYYPHPETKPAHIQPNSMLEVIAPKIPQIGYDACVKIRCNQRHIRFQRGADN